MSVMLALGRSEAIFDNDAFPDAPDDVPGSVVQLGPFDYVELTYDLLRVGSQEKNLEGDVIGHFREGLWWLADETYPFSDLDIYAGTEAK